MEIIQTEGFEAVRKVDPNMVIKKVKGVDAEVQDGWDGPCASLQAGARAAAL